MYMFKYICKRIGLMLMTFTIIFTICFVLIKLLPIDISMLKEGENTIVFTTISGSNFDYIDIYSADELS